MDILQSIHLVTVKAKAGAGLRRSAGIQVLKLDWRSKASFRYRK